MKLFDLLSLRPTGVIRGVTAGGEWPHDLLWRVQLDAREYTATLFQLAVESSPSGVLIVDPEGKIVVGAALMSGLLAGYAMAKRRHRSWFHVIAYAAIIALTVYTVIDLDHPRFGLINIDAAYQPFVELRKAIE